MADRLKMTPDALIKELKSGKSFAQIAQDHGVTIPPRGSKGGSSSKSSSHPTKSSAAASSIRR
jgi:hypothetical protein